MNANRNDSLDSEQKGNNGFPIRQLFARPSDACRCRKRQWGYFEPREIKVGPDSRRIYRSARGRSEGEDIVVFVAISN